VQVRLKEAGAQGEVLASLKASEFRLEYVFEKHPGFLGYANKVALDKLAANPDVAAVCLDDQPLVEGPVKPIYRDDLPPPKAGEAAGPGAKEDQVEPDVHRILAIADRALVLVSLRADSLPEVADPSMQSLEKNELRRKAARQLRQRVLATLSADDLHQAGGLADSAAVTGFITAKGLQKLCKHPDVVRVSPVSRARPLGTVSSGPS